MNQVDWGVTVPPRLPYLSFKMPSIAPHKLDGAVTDSCMTVLFK